MPCKKSRGSVYRPPLFLLHASLLILAARRVAGHAISLAAMYVRLARREEREALVQFGEAYATRGVPCVSSTPPPQYARGEIGKAELRDGTGA